MGKGINMEPDFITPDLTDIPTDDSAEPSDANVEHLASEEEVEENV